MTDRKVIKSGKGDGNVITKLCNSNEFWSPRQKEDAIDDIDSGRHSYYTMVRGTRADIHVVNLGGKKHLRTDRDGKGSNNLEELPDC